MPNTAAAGTRHRHPWLFQLACGEGGQLMAQPSSMKDLKAFEVELVSVTTGACEHSLKASFPASSDGGDSAVAGETQRTEPQPVSNGEGIHEVGRLGSVQIQMDELEQRISRQQHSVFWEEIFETLKTEALVDGKDGWVVHHDARCGDDVGANRRVAREMMGRMDAGSKRRLVSSSPREATLAGRTAGARVVHVLDDEVMVEMNSHFQLAYRLVSGQSSSGAPDLGSCTTEKDRSEATDRKQAASLCQLALLYCGSLIRQQQRAQEVARRISASNTGAGREVGARLPAGAAGGRVGNGTAGGYLSATSTWKAVRRVLLHHLFRSEVSTPVCMYLVSVSCRPLLANAIRPTAIHVVRRSICFRTMFVCSGHLHLFGTIGRKCLPRQKAVQFPGVGVLLNCSAGVSLRCCLCLRFAPAVIG